MLPARRGTDQGRCLSGPFAPRPRATALAPILPIIARSIREAAPLWIFDDKAPQFDAQASPIVRSILSMLKSWEKLDDYTVAINTTVPFSHFPYLVARILIVSPTAWEKAGRNWAEFAKAPAGTGPFKITKVTPRVSVEMARNPDYWDKDRIPKLDRMIVMPMPEANTRVAALRAGQVDWIEVPPADAIESLKSAGFQISLWPYPHTWPYVLDTTGDSPFRDKRVRQAYRQLLTGELELGSFHQPQDRRTVGQGAGDFRPGRARHHPRVSA